MEKYHHRHYVKPEKHKWYEVKYWQKDTRIFWSVVLICVVVLGGLSFFTPKRAQLEAMASPQINAILEKEKDREIKTLAVTYNSLGFVNYLSYTTTGNAPIKENYIGFAGHIFPATVETYKYLRQQDAEKYVALKNRNTKELTYLARSEDINANIYQSNKIQISERNAYRFEYYFNDSMVGYKETERDTNTTTAFYLSEGQFVKAAEDLDLVIESNFSENVVVKDQYGEVIADESKGDTITLEDNSDITVNGQRLVNGKKTFASVAGELITYTYRLLGRGENWLHGAKLTLLLTTVTVILGMLLGTLLALGKMSKIKLISAPCSAYIFFFRGTPLLIQLFVIYFAIPGIIPGFSWASLSSVDGLGAFYAAALAFALNSGAYCAETVRAAIQSIDKGQHEAAKALGMSYGMTMTQIIIPQSIRRLIPPIANEFILVLKDASLVFVISLMDITTISKTISAKGNFIVFIPALAIYLIITAFFTFVFNKLEAKFSVYE